MPTAGTPKAARRRREPLHAVSNPQKGLRSVLLRGKSPSSTPPISNARLHIPHCSKGNIRAFALLHRSANKPIHPQAYKPDPNRRRRPHAYPCHRPRVSTYAIHLTSIRRSRCSGSTQLLQLLQVRGVRLDREAVCSQGEEGCGTYLRFVKDQKSWMDR